MVNVKFKRFYHAIPPQQKRRDFLLTLGVISACFGLSFQVFVLHQHHEKIDKQLKDLTSLIEANSDNILNNTKLIEERMKK